MGNCSSNSVGTATASRGSTRSTSRRYDKQSAPRPEARQTQDWLNVGNNSEGGEGIDPPVPVDTIDSVGSSTTPSQYAELTSELDQYTLYMYRQLLLDEGALEQGKDLDSPEESLEEIAKIKVIERRRSSVLAAASPTGDECEFIPTSILRRSNEKRRSSLNVTSVTLNEDDATFGASSSTASMYSVCSDDDSNPSNGPTEGVSTISTTGGVAETRSVLVQASGLKMARSVSFDLSTPASPKTDN